MDPQNDIRVSCPVLCFIALVHTTFMYYLEYVIGNVSPIEAKKPDEMSIKRDSDDKWQISHQYSLCEKSQVLD